MFIVKFLRALATFIERVASFENKRLTKVVDKNDRAKKAATKLEVVRKMSADDARNEAVKRADESRNNAIKKAGEDCKKDLSKLNASNSKINETRNELATLAGK